MLECVARRRTTVSEATNLPDEQAPAGLLLPGTDTRPTGDRPLDALRDIFGEDSARASWGSGVYVIHK